MTEKNEITREEFKKIENYMGSYSFCRRLIEMSNYEKKYFETLEWQAESPAEFSLAKAKMYEVRNFIMSMPNCNEKVFLYFHYVHGETVERCAEMMGISRSSAFRLKKKALIKAYLYGVSENKPMKAM